MKEFDTTKFCGADTGRGYNMTTASGKPFYPADPRAEDIRIEDIARHLSRICRFNGALKDGVWIVDVLIPNLYKREIWKDFEIYSVAQHSVLVCDHVEDPELKLAALLHDAAEAYCGDMTKPLKPLHPGRKELERRIERVIEERFGLPANILEHPAIKEQDCRAVLTEHRDLQANNGTDWGLETATEAEKPWAEQIIPVLPSAAYRLFMTRFDDLYKGD